MKVILSVSNEGCSLSVSDKGYVDQYTDEGYQIHLSVSNEGYFDLYLMKVILSVSDEKLF